jgi:hypothetical protein
MGEGNAATGTPIERGGAVRVDGKEEILRCENWGDFSDPDFAEMLSSVSVSKRSEKRELYEIKDHEILVEERNTERRHNTNANSHKTIIVHRPPPIHQSYKSVRW